MTVGELLKVIDIERNVVCTIEVLDTDGEVEARFRADSELLDAIDDREIDCIENDKIRLWLKSESV